MNTDHLSQYIRTLEASLEWLNTVLPDSADYEIFRNATVKGFELTLEIAGKLLRKALKQYVATPRMTDELTYKEVFRHAAKHGLLEPIVVERWFLYRDNHNDTAHDYGIAFANTTLCLLPQFIQDARALQQVLKQTRRNDSAGS